MQRELIMFFVLSVDELSTNIYSKLTSFWDSSELIVYLIVDSEFLVRIMTDIFISLSRRVFWEMCSGIYGKNI